MLGNILSKVEVFFSFAHLPSF